MKKTLIIIAALALSLFMNAQTIASRQIENGGQGEFKSIVVSDESLPDFTIYRPADLQAAVNKLGPLPVIVFANGGCSRNPRDDEKFNSEIASYGFVLIGVGKYSELSLDEVHAAIKFLGEEKIKFIDDTVSVNLIQDIIDEYDPKGKSQPSDLIDGMNWAQKQASNPNSEYYHMIDPNNIGIMGSSCGGVQALEVSYDTRIKTLIMKNSGMMKMRGNFMNGISFEQENLQEIKVPMLYMCGDETDLAYKNAASDFETLNNIPVAFCSCLLCGHMGTTQEPFGGEMSRIVIAWLQSQLRGDKEATKVFTDPKVQHKSYDNWIIKSKNFPTK